MVKRFLPLICFLSICSHAHHQAFLEQKSVEEIGDALVHVTFDRFYDRYHWGLACFDKSSEVFPPMSVRISVAEVAECGVSFTFSESSDEVADKGKLEYRFDDQDPIVVDYKLSALNNRHAIVDFEQEEFATFLESFSKASAITFSMDDYEDTLPLKEMTKAVERFREILAESYIIELESSDLDNDEEDPSETSENEEPSTTDS